MAYVDPNTHNDRIDITVNLAALYTSGASFDVLYIATDATLDGTNVVTYSSVAEVAAALAATQISAQAAADLTDMMSQTRNRISRVKVATWDLAGGIDTLADALDDAIAEDSDFFYITCEVRAPANLIVLMADVETKAASGNKFLLVMQDNDADWLTAGLPAAWATAAGKEWSAHIYHDIDTEPAAACWLANRASFDPDEESPPWNAPVYNVAALTTGVTQAQKAFIRSNESNVGLPFGTAYTFYVDPGQNCNGRSVSQLVTNAWYEVRIREALADLIAGLSDEGQKLEVSVTGQQQVLGALNGVFGRGVKAGHFVTLSGDTTAWDALAITSADLTARRLRFEGRAQTAEGAITVTLEANLSTDAI